MFPQIKTHVQSNQTRNYANILSIMCYSNLTYPGLFRNDIPRLTRSSQYLIQLLKQFCSY